jgi:hypothetical protein
MSFIMTAVVVLPMRPDAQLDAALTAEGPRGYQLHRIELGSETTYSPLLDAYAGTYNHVADEFLEWLSGLPWVWSDGGWPYPREQVIVLTHHEYSEIAPLVYGLTKDGWTRLDPKESP